MKTELSTRDFISQWPYDDGHDICDETSMQWRSVDRVAEHVRQREHHLENGYDGVDFETRAAALEAYFLGAPRCGTILSERKAPQVTKAVRRVRPQSASSTRRVAEISGVGPSSNEMRERQRPQSAKYRSEMPRDDKNINRVDWNTPTQSRTSKWREMLARGPKFEQLSLRKLELETYELLSRTFEQRREVDVQPSARRRRKGKTESNANSEELARGSGLHLARSRKKRQQEHDREMMLGKGRQSLRRSKQDKPKDVCEDKTAIQDKTRRRGKLLKTKVIQKPLQEPAHHLLKQDKQPRESRLQRPTSAHRARGLYVSSGLSTSVDIRYTSSGNSELLMAQDKRIAQLFDAFQRYAETRSKNVPKQLKKAQQSAKTIRRSELRKTEQIHNSFPESNDCVNCERPFSASVGTASVPISRGNQEDDRDRSPVLQEPILYVAALQSQLPPPRDTLFSESLVTPTLVIPPLKLPSNLWECQQSQDTQDEISERSQCRSWDHSSIGQGSTNPVNPFTATPVDENSDTIISSTPKSEGLQTDGMSNQTASLSYDELGRGTTVEEGYLAESLAEQANTGLSTGDSESSPPAPRKEYLEDKVLLADSEEHVDDKLSASRNGKASDLSDTSNGNGKETTQSASQSNETQVIEDISTNPTEEFDSQLREADGTVSQSTEEVEFAGTTEVSNWSAPEVGNSVMKDENDITSNSELQSRLENNMSENQSSTTETISTADSYKAIAISGGTVEPQPPSDHLVNLIGYRSDGEHGQGAHAFTEPEVIHDVDPRSVSVPLIDTEGEHCYTPSIKPESLEVVMTNGEDEFVSSLPWYNHLPASGEDVGAMYDLDSDTTINEKQLIVTLAENPDVSFSANCGSTVLEERHNLDSDVPSQLLDDFGVMVETNNARQHSTTELKGTVDCGDSAADVRQLEDSENHSNSKEFDKHARSEAQSAVAPNALPLDYSTLTILHVEDPTQSGISPSTPLIETIEAQLALETKLDIVPTKSSSLARSPKKTKKSKTAASDTSATPKKKKKKLVIVQSTPGIVEIVTTTSLPVQTCSPHAHSSNNETVEEDFLRLGQQELTRSFLKRISSRKMVETESMSFIQAESPVEQVECGDILESIESVTATAVMDIKTQLEQATKPVKERENIDGECVSLLKSDFFQILNDCESTMEKYPTVTEDPAIPLNPATTPSTEKVDMAASFTSVDDDSSLASAVINIFGANPEESKDPLDTMAQTPLHNEPNNSTDDNQIPIQVVSQLVLTTPDNVAFRIDAKEIADKDHTMEHHDVARKIQTQYRCFVRRRIILDQLRFILAKERRKARKSRHKVKKARPVDTATREENVTAVVYVATDASNMDNLQEEVQQVASIPMRSEIGVEMTSTAHSSEAPELSEQTMKLGSRRGSCEYAFKIFDDPEETKGEVVQKSATSVVDSTVEDKLSMRVVSDAATNEPTPKKLDDHEQEDLAALPEKDAMVASIDVITNFELPQVEEADLFEKSVLLPSEAIEVTLVNNNTASPAGAGLVTSMKLADLVFSEDVEEEPAAFVEAASEGVPQVQLHWERYVDSTTSKSFYYSPSTNETQWTAPTEDRDNAAINSPRVTPTTPRTAAATATDAVSPSGHSLSAQETTDTWQEFLDEATGHLYYYNTKTGECSWEPPASKGDSSGVVESLQSVTTAESAAIGARPWIMYIDPVSQAPYYVNTETLVTSWEQPEEFVVAEQPAEDKYVIAVDDHAALQI